MAPETQRDAQAVASEFVIRVERDDQRAPRAVDVQAAVGSTLTASPPYPSGRSEIRCSGPCCSPRSPIQLSKGCLRKPSCTTLAGGAGKPVMRSSTNDQRAPHALHDNRICNL